MSLKARAVKVADAINIQRFFDCRSILKRVIDSDLDVAKELIDLVDEWASGGDIADSYPTGYEMAGFLADDEVVGAYGSRTTFAKWLKDAKQGKFDFETARAAIKSIEASRNTKAKGSSGKQVTKQVARQTGTVKKRPTRSRS
jgi:hypothetical protein